MVDVFLFICAAVCVVVSTYQNLGRASGNRWSPSDKKPHAVEIFFWCAVLFLAAPLWIHRISNEIWIDILACLLAIAVATLLLYTGYHALYLIREDVGLGIVLSCVWLIVVCGILLCCFSVYISRHKTSVELPAENWQCTQSTTVKENNRDVLYCEQYTYSR